MTHKYTTKHTNVKGEGGYVPKVLKGKRCRELHVPTTNNGGGYAATTTTTTIELYQRDI